MGPPKIAFSCLISGFMVDITIVNGGYFMVYKPTNISGGAYPVVWSQLVQHINRSNHDRNH